MSNSVPNTDKHNITFLGSFPDVRKAPPSALPEFAFIGRSNVGKSSLINYLCNRKKLAKTSGTPGKTQYINLFDVEGEWILADLPGYGYARISKRIREKWGKLIEHYLTKRENLRTAFLLVDSRHEPIDSDLEQIRWLGKREVPFSLVFTKADKLKPDEIERNVNMYMQRLEKEYETLPNHFVTSASGKMGRVELLDYIDHVSRMEFD
ncbi:MAG: ribosome biogenesis GTP-binding protein YihA/YsxC [Bacteroidota bacterium]